MMPAPCITVLFLKERSWQMGRLKFYLRCRKSLVFRKANVGTILSSTLGRLL